MLIAHIPAGYILGRTARAERRVMLAVLLASVLPDFDMVWFHLVDAGRVHHHRYWTHAPGFWALIAAIALLAAARWKPQWLWPATLCFFAIFLHLVMDTLVGDIMWLWPFSARFFHIATVPATYSNWVMSFVLHWSFLAELLICALALVLFLQRAPR